MIGRPREDDRLGWVKLLKRTKPGECPCCGEPTRPLKSANRAETKKTHRILCGDEECKRAQLRLHKRDQRRRERKAAEL